MKTAENTISWSHLTENKAFISDLGANQDAELNGTHIRVGRYAVWSPLRNSKNHQVVEVSNDLTALIEKYKIPSERILTLVREEGDLHG